MEKNIAILPLQEYDRLKEIERNRDREIQEIKSAQILASEAYSNMLIIFSELHYGGPSGFNKLLEDVSTHPKSFYTYSIENQKLTFQKRRNEENNDISE